MASTSCNSSVKCSILAVPTQYLLSTSNKKQSGLSKDLSHFQWGSNTLIVNKSTFIKLGLGERELLRTHWAVLQVKLSKQFYAKDQAISKRIFHVTLNRCVSDDVVILSDDLLFNLEQSCCPISHKLTGESEPFLILTNESCSSTLKPEKAIRLVISLFKCESYLEESFVDKLLVKYFSNVRYLCENDVFSVPLPDTLLELSSNASLDTVYFKVCEIQGSWKRNKVPGLIEGFLVDSNVTIYQTTNHQGLVPSRKFSLFLANLHVLLEDEHCLKDLIKRRCDLLPASFDTIFRTLLGWIEPFLISFSKIQEAEVNPVFLIHGKNGTGKTMLLDAASKYCGLAYLRYDCVGAGAVAPGQAEAKLKNIFSQSTKAAPCILHLANIEALCHDAELKDDVRVISYFEQHIKQLKSNWPVIIIATSENRTNISPLVNQLFLETTLLKPPSAEEREVILSYLVKSQGDLIDSQTLQSVAAHTSGFVFRDLQVLVSLAFKKKYKRLKDNKEELRYLTWSDFSKTIDFMHKSYSDSIGAPKVPSVSWKDVGGLENLKKEILRSLRSNMFSSGLKRSGLLLHGPPGTGKTLLAKAVATQCGRNFLSVKGPELLNMYVGQSEHNVRDLFELAKAASPCIVFFDELDSLAPNRGRSGDSGGVMDRVVSQLLAEMDDLGSSADVFVLGATNRPDLIDPALLRPGRLDKLLYVGPCEDRNSQLSVITALTRKLSLDSDVHLPAVVSLLPSSVSGAQLSALCSAAWMSAARQLIQGGENKCKLEPSVVVTQDHFLSAINVISGC